MSAKGESNTRKCEHNVNFAGAKKKYGDPERDLSSRAKSCSSSSAGNRADLDRIAVNSAADFGLLSDQFVEFIGGRFVASLQSVNLVSHHEGVFGSLLEAGVSATDRITWHHMLGSAHRIAHDSGEGLPAGAFLVSLLVGQGRHNA